MEKIRRSGGNLRNENEQLYIRQNSRVSYDLKMIHDLVPEKEFLKMVKLNKRDVEKYINKRVALKDKVVKNAQVSYTSPFLAVKKLK